MTSMAPLPFVVAASDPSLSGRPPPSGMRRLLLGGCWCADPALPQLPAIVGTAAGRRILVVAGQHLVLPRVDQARVSQFPRLIQNAGAAVALDGFLPSIPALTLRSSGIAALNLILAAPVSECVEVDVGAASILALKVSADGILARANIVEERRGHRGNV